MRKMFCFDMDNTLLEHTTHTIPQSALDVLDEIRAAGDLVVVATGRNMDEPYSEAYRECSNPDAIVHCNGHKVTVGGETIFEEYFDQKLLARVIDFAQKEKICIGTISNGVNYFANVDYLFETNHRFAKFNRMPYKPAEDMLGNPIYGLSFFGSEEQADMLRNEFPMLSIMMFLENIGADVVCTEITKANGIAKLLEYYDMDFSQVVAFGDSQNDIAMLKRASVGVAMGNATVEVKAAANMVTFRAEEDGIALAYRKICSK